MEIRHFPELSNRDLYEILKLRSQVFIVEQKGCYLDPDGIDCESTHIYQKEADGSVSGCIRVYLKPDEPGTVQLGRLVVRDRMQGLGRRLMEAAEEIALTEYGCRQLFLTGRRSARGFYEKCGYTARVPQGFCQEDAPYFLFRRHL